jgi:hypothetical protein
MTHGADELPPQPTKTGKEDQEFEIELVNPPD